MKSVIKAQVENAALKICILALVGEMARDQSAAESNAMVQRLLEDGRDLSETIGVDAVETGMSEQDARAAIRAEVDGVFGTIKFHD